MAQHYKTQGFVFKKCERNENDKVFTIFTRHFGKIDVTGRAMRKITSKLCQNIDIFSVAEIGFVQGKNSKILIDAEKMAGNPGLKKDPEKMKAAYEISAMLSGFIKGQEPDEKIFLLLEDFFKNFSESKIAVQNRMAAHYFFWNLVSLLGYRIEAENCAICKNALDESRIYFSSGCGGAVCAECSKGREGLKKVNSDVIKILRLILRQNWDVFSRIKISSALESIMEELLRGAERAFLPENC